MSEFALLAALWPLRPSTPGPSPLRVAAAIAVSCSLPLRGRQLPVNSTRDANQPVILEPSSASRAEFMCPCA